ncbi:hypothetical protein MCUN1_000185 [Malassezia cuniculi]|uniref:RlpA-like protein double-psi beta-barrel domain-containing protein n=1 Tax=Malassezia cuniculi TaxID=948313 RepID=A0AAF0J4E5_9BASI|nr:hypothetical protein MCUN1_000185 [Malassezia cuniculi]
MKFNAIILTALIALTGYAAAAEDAPRGHERKAQFLEKRTSSKRSGGGKMTWYGGGMLDAPACGGKPPGKYDNVVAVAQNSGYGSCNQKVRLHYKGRTEEATIRDYCADCGFGHFDATQGLFQKFADLDVGVLSNVEYELL